MQQLSPVHPSATVAPHVVTGRWGEHAARCFLSQKGYRILGMNVHIGQHDEIDLIAYDPADNVMVFVEVKTRVQNDDDYQPELNITRMKRICMVRAARRWVTEHAWQGGYRLDVITVAGGAVKAHYVEIEWGA